ncbi:MAG TPA: ATP-binding protein [Gemmatimonadaceae bacterium]
MPHPVPPRAPSLPSLRTELLLSLGVLAAAALLIAVVSVLLFVELVETRYGIVYISAVLAADVVVFVAFGAYQLRRLILAPVAEAAAVAEAIAGGDLERRVAASGSAELASLAASINRMTDRLLEERAHLVRMEKLAGIGRLAAGIAHEIGNPLGAINGYVHLLRRALGREPGMIETLDGLEHEARRIDRIVRALLDYARPRRVTPAPVDINACARGAVLLLETQGALRGVTVTLDLDATAAPVPALRHDVDQIFVNLLLNAVDAMEGEGRIVVCTRATDGPALLAPNARRAGDGAKDAPAREPSARVRAWLDRTPRGPVLEVVVADSGPGVPPGDAERIFDPFFTTKPPGKGTGLGLAIVARTVESLGGTIWVQRAREGGAAFVLLLPIVAMRGSSGVRAVEAPAGALPAPARAGAAR